MEAAPPAAAAPTPGSVAERDRDMMLAAGAAWDVAAVAVVVVTMALAAASDAAAGLLMFVGAEVDGRSRERQVAWRDDTAGLAAEAVVADTPVWLLSPWGAEDVVAAAAAPVLLKADCDEFVEVMLSGCETAGMRNRRGSTAEEEVEVDVGAAVADWVWRSGYVSKRTRPLLAADGEDGEGKFEWLLLLLVTTLVLPTLVLVAPAGLCSRFSKWFWV